MITHIVFFRFKDTSLEALTKAKELLMNMEGQIPSLKHIEVGLNVLTSGRAYDLALVAHFDHLDGLQAYDIHPVHLQVAAYLKEAIRESPVSVDYEA
ncbi:MAG: Dabb family protein [Gorillibacterium sp.]|nr:Dabb family protein [Gorillibacterium sp.]